MTPCPLSICSDAGWAPRVPRPPLGKHGIQGCSSPHSPETRLCSCTRTKHTVRHSGGPSAKDRGLQGLPPRATAAVFPRILDPGGPGSCSPSRSISNTPAASSGVRQRNSLAGSVWRRWRPGDPGIPDGRCRGEGFRQWMLGVDILGAAATQGVPNFRRGLCDKEGPSTPVGEGRWSGGWSSSPRESSRAMAPLASVAGDLEWGVWALGRSGHVGHRFLLPCACSGSLDPFLSVSLTPVYVQIQPCLCYEACNLRVALSTLLCLLSPCLQALSRGLLFLGTCERIPLTRTTGPVTPEAVLGLRSQENPGPAFVAGVAGQRMTVSSEISKAMPHLHVTPGKTKPAGLCPVPNL